MHWQYKERNIKCDCLCGNAMWKKAQIENENAHSTVMGKKGNV